MLVGGLVVFTVFIMFLARIVAPPTDYTDQLIKDSVRLRIAPVGQVRTAANSDQPAAGAEEAVAAVKTPKELYDGVCGACHTSGVAGAPKLDDAAEWSKRAEMGIDALVASAITGKGAMPPKGGSSYNDEEMKAVVEFLLGQ
jgi:cytochrome c5